MQSNDTIASPAALAGLVEMTGVPPAYAITYKASPRQLPDESRSSMRLANFIVSNREPILAEWEAFARTCEPACDSMDILALRDHANAMLSAVAVDLGTPQSELEQSEKSKGHGWAEDPSVTTAAQAHGAGRAMSGFTVEQMVAEYRALRASVIHLWTRGQGVLGAGDIEDLMRFNEAIDQALAESVTYFTRQVEQAKEIFIAMLGHDLRVPLAAIYSSARFVAETGDLEEPHLTLVEGMAGSATRTIRMVSDLLDFTRSRLGGGIPIVRAKMSLGKVLHEVVDEVRTAHPGAVIHVDTRGQQEGEWDAGRLGQAFANLVGNAVDHGSGTAVSIEIGGDQDETVVAIHNRGDVIPAERINGIFNPMKVTETPQRTSANGAAGHLGLGLYIAERVVTGHGGRIQVASSELHGTTFTVYLPRRLEEDTPVKGPDHG